MKKINVGLLSTRLESWPPGIYTVMRLPLVFSLSLYSYPINVSLVWDSFYSIKGYIIEYYTQRVYLPSCLDTLYWLPVVPKQGVLWPPGNTRQCLGTLKVPNCGVGVTGIWWVEAGDAAPHATRLSAAPTRVPLPQLSTEPRLRSPVLSHVC